MCVFSGVESDLQQSNDPSRAGERRPAGETTERFITQQESAESAQWNEEETGWVRLQGTLCVFFTHLGIHTSHVSVVFLSPFLLYFLMYSFYFYDHFIIIVVFSASFDYNEFIWCHSTPLLLLIWSLSDCDPSSKHNWNINKNMKYIKICVNDIYCVNVNVNLVGTMSQHHCIFYCIAFQSCITPHKV